MQHARNVHWDNAKRVNKYDVRSVLQFQQLLAPLRQHSLSGWGRWKGKVYSSTVFCTFHAVFTLPLLSFFYNVCSHESIKLFPQSFELLSTTESLLVRWRSVSGKVALGLGVALEEIYKRWARYKRWHGCGGEWKLCQDGRKTFARSIYGHLRKNWWRHIDVKLWPSCCNQTDACQPKIATKPSNLFTIFYVFASDKFPLITG